MSFAFPSRSEAVTRTWDGGGADGTCGGAAGDGNKWSCTLNWSDDTVPGSSDVATFDATSTKNATIDASFGGSVSGVNIASGYTGIITQARSLTVGDSDYTQADGTFAMSTFTMTMGGDGSDFIKTGGTFNEETGTVEFTGSSSSTINITTSETFYNLIVNIAAANSGLAISAGDTVIVTNDLTLTDGHLSGTTGIVEVQGHITQASTFNNTTTNNTATIDFGGAGAQTYTINGGNGPKLRLDSAADASDTLILNADGALYGYEMTSDFSGTAGTTYNGFTLTIDVGDFTQAAGTFDAPTTMIFHANNSSGANFIKTGGTFNEGTGTVQFGGSGNSDSSTIDVATSETFYNIIVNVSEAGKGLAISAGDTVIVTNDLTLTDGHLSGTTGVVEVQGNITQASTFNNSSQNNTATIDFGGAGAQTYTINGGNGPKLRLDSAADASDTLILNANATMYGYEMTSDFSGTAGTTYNGFTLTIDVGDFTQAAGTFDAPTTMIFYASGSSGADFIKTGGTFNEGTGTIQFGTSGSDSSTINVATSETFYNIIANASGGGLVISAGDTVIVSNDLTLTDGYLFGSTGVVEVHGNITQASTFDSTASTNNATIDFGGAGAQTYTINGGNGPKLRLDSAADASDTLILNANATMYGYEMTSGFSGTAGTTYNGFTLTIGLGDFTQAAGTFNAPTTMIFNDSGNSGAGFTKTGGTFNEGTGTVQFGNGTSDDGVFIDVATSETFYNIIVNVSHTGEGLTIFSGDTIIVSNDFTHSDGYVNTGNLEVQGNFTVGASANAGTSPVKFSGGNNQTYTDNGGDEINADYTVDKSANTLTLASNADWNATNQDLTITTGTFSQGATFALLTGALTVSTNGIWTNTGTGDITLGGAVSNAGTITLNSNGGSCADADDIVLTDAGTTQRTWSGAGTFTLYDLNVSDMAGSITTRGSTDSGNNDLTLDSCHDSPDAPSGLAPASYVDGSWGNDNTPTLTFNLSDPNGADTVQYTIQIDDSSDFSSVLVDYTSALAAQGSASFTVGQAAGSGSYTVGSSGQTLSDSSSYYWRVKAIDNGASESSYVTANSGAIAFKVDATAPTAGSLSAIDTSTTSVTVLISGASDALSGLASSPYLFQNTTNSTNSGQTSSTSWESTGLNSEQSYSFNAVVSDTAGNTATTSTINQSTGSSGGGGGGGGGGGSSPPPSPTPSPTPEPTPSPSPTPEPTPSPSPTPEPTPSPTPEPTPEPTPSPSPTPSSGSGPDQPSGETPSPSSGGGGALFNDIIDSIFSPSRGNTSLGSGLELIDDRLKPLADNVVKTVQTTVESATTVARNLEENPVTNTLEKSVIIIPVSTTALVLITSLLSGISFINYFLYLLTLLAQLLGIKRKPKPWGTVYDSSTKKPISFARVEILNKESRKLESVVADSNGRYGFLISNQIYKHFVIQLRASQNNYTFPSQQQPGMSEQIAYPNIYRGGLVNAVEGLNNFDLPMDPVGKPLTHNFYPNITSMKLNNILTETADVFFVVGAIFGIINFIINPNSFNFVFLIAILLTYVLRTFGFKLKSFGLTKDKDTSQAMPFSLVALHDLSGERAGFTVSDDRGRYFLLTSKGKHVIKAYTPSYISPMRTRDIPISTSKGWVSQEIRL